MKKLECLDKISLLIDKDTNRPYKTIVFMSSIEDMSVI